MKKLLVTLGLALLTLGMNAAQANAPVNEQVAEQISAASLDSAVSLIQPFDLINWKVGDTANYNISLGAFGNVGKMVKSVTRDEGHALWVRQQMDLRGQNEIIDILINKADGKVLKMIRNGKEQTVPDEKLEIISQDYTEITVPAGTFQVLHIVAKTKQVSKIELWANPVVVVMDGAVKQVMASGFAGDITMVLTSQARGN